MITLGKKSISLQYLRSSNMQFATVSILSGPECTVPLIPHKHMRDHWKGQDVLYRAQWDVVG